MQMNTHKMSNLTPYLEEGLALSEISECGKNMTPFSIQKSHPSSIPDFISCLIPTSGSIGESIG